MGTLLTIIDSTLFIYFVIIAIVVPILDAQTCLPHEYFPDFLLNLKQWYAHEYGDYLVLEKPHFFIGLVWVELLFLWPLSVANICGILLKKKWFRTTCLIYGVSVFTSMAAILAEMIGSQKASDKLLKMYFPFLGLAILAIFRGILPLSCETTSSDNNKKATHGRKKRM